MSAIQHLPVGKLIALLIPQRPWLHIGIDFAKDLPTSDGFTGVFLTGDLFPKACKLILLIGLPTSMKMTKHLLMCSWKKQQDQSPQFTSHKAFFLLFKLLCITLNPSLLVITRKHTNGQTEREIQELGQNLRSYCHDNQNSFKRYPPQLPSPRYRQFIFTKITPFQCIFG